MTQTVKRLICAATAALLSLSAGVVTTHAMQTPVLLQNFNHDGSLSLANLGFSGVDYWVFDSLHGTMTSPSPGGWSELSRATTVPFQVASRNSGVVLMEWTVAFPTEYGGSWRENNKIWASLLDGQGCGYELLYKPNRAQDRYTSFDLELKRIDVADSTVLKQAWTHTLTPHGAAAPPSRGEDGSCRRRGNRSTGRCG